MLYPMLRYLTTQRCIKTFLFIVTILSNYNVHHRCNQVTIKQKRTIGRPPLSNLFQPRKRMIVTSFFKIMYWGDSLLSTLFPTYFDILSFFGPIYRHHQVTLLLSQSIYHVNHNFWDDMCQFNICRSSMSRIPSGDKGTFLFINQNT